MNVDDTRSLKLVYGIANKYESERDERHLYTVHPVYVISTIKKVNDVANKFLS